VCACAAVGERRHVGVPAEIEKRRQCVRFESHLFEAVKCKSRQAGTGKMLTERENRGKRERERLREKRERGEKGERQEAGKREESGKEKLQERESL